jgi:ABC-type multidrug transport system fused ATPase/permease subunit
LESDEHIESKGDYKPAHIQGHLALRNVFFEYPNGTVALKDVNFEIKPNEITALVGLSGAGKSTIINLLDKFYEPSSGQIFLDGVDLAKYDTAFLRRHIGMVLQRNHIFKGTIFENIEYGKMGSSREEIIEAAKKAYIHEQIMDLPKGYDSDAQSLSGGQQQRIAIARLFLKNPPIIFLDEPTANLDAIATEQIKNSLDAIKKDRTVIIVSHSISQIIDSNAIVVMEKGMVVEKGQHEDLYAHKGTYYDIFSAMANSLNLNKISRTLHADER